MEIDIKDHIKLRLAACFRIILKRKKGISENNRKNNVEDIRLVDSMRQLEAESGLSYTIIQGAFSGKRDIQFTSLITMIENLGITFSDFAKLYDKLTEKQISDEIANIEIKKRKSIKKKAKINSNLQKN